MVRELNVINVGIENSGLLQIRNKLCAIIDCRTIKLIETVKRSELIDIVKETRFSHDETHLPANIVPSMCIFYLFIYIILVLVLSIFNSLLLLSLSVALSSKLPIGILLEQLINR